MSTRKVAAWGVGIALAVAGVLWAVLRSIDPATYAAWDDNLTTIGLWLLWASAVGQTGFTALWFTRPWHRENIGRALMVKSLSLAIYLDFALVVYYIEPFPALPTLSSILFGFIAVGIWSQFVTLVAVLWRAREEEKSSPFPSSAAEESSR